MHVYECEPPSWGIPDREVHYYEAPLIRDLKPYIDRVHTLELESHHLDGDFVGRVVKFWLDHGDASLAKSLLVRQESGDEVLFDGLQSYVTLMNTTEYGKKVLLSLQTLRLYDIIFNWDSDAYRGLTDLQLGFEPDSSISTVSILEFTRILISSPLLASLKLRGLLVTQTDNLHHTTPISLEHLRVLDLIGLDMNSLKILLPWIALPTSSPKLSVALSVSDCIQNELKHFLSHSSVTELYCSDQTASFQAWSSILVPLSSLHSLTLSDFGLEGMVLPSKEHRAVFQRPISLTLKKCCPPFDVVNSLLSELGVQKICMEETVYTQDYGIDQPSGVYWQSFRTSLIQAHPNLQYVGRHTI
ncbi:hypothetical protein FRC07_008776 [Ceratobasidium sp. 392]|nr:hypothetical protein FRC07_008776 [Ceratobasidium sp. 392]